MVHSTALRLARLEAAEDIRRIIATYAVGADKRNDPDILGPLFHDDASWEAIGLTRLETRSVIAKGLRDLANSFVTWSIHYMVSPLITISEDALSATCRWYLWELCTMTGEDGVARDTWLGGWYDSNLSCRGGLWAFDAVTLDMRLTSPTEAPWTGRKGD